MKILTLKIQNYGSFFGEHEFRMGDRGLVFVCGDNQDEPRMDSNGSGKSTLLFEAGDWCLFGEIPKGDHVDSVVNEESGKRCVVTVDVLDTETGEVGRIVRARKPNKLQFFKGPPDHLEDLTALDAATTQAAIESFLGLDRAVFHAAVYRAQGDDFDFANASDADKKALLSRIIPELSEVDQLRDQTKQCIALAESELASTWQEIARLESSITALESIDWDAREAEWQAQWQARRSMAEQEERNAAATVANYAAQVGDEAKLKQDLAALDATPPIQVRTGAAEALEAHRQAMQDVSSRLAVARSTVQQAQAQYQSIQNLTEGPCSRCGQQVTGAHLEKERHTFMSAMDAAGAEYGTIQSEYQALDAKTRDLQVRASAELQEAQAKSNAHQQALGALRAQLSAIQTAAQQLRKAETDHLRRQGSIEVIQAEKWPGAKEKESTQRTINEQAAKLDELRPQIADKEQYLQCLNFWLTAFGLRGLKSLILDSRLEDLTTAANEWVRMLTGDTHWVRFESQTMTRGGKLSDKINIRVFHYNPDGSISDRNYPSYSGGEKKRVALGIDWGLSCLVASRASKTWDLYVIDESFRQHIDSGGREALFELLEQLQKSRSSIYVIDHDHEMESHFESKVLVSRRNQRSTIVEEFGCRAA